MRANQIMPASFVGLVLGFAGVVWAGEHDPIHEVSKGEFTVAKLRLSEGTAQAPQTLFLSMRDGKLGNFWFVEQGYERINLIESSLQLKENKLSGDLRLRLCPDTSRREHFATAGWSFELEVDGEELKHKVLLSP